jgi:hypothetical protein
VSFEEEPLSKAFNVSPHQHTLVILQSFVDSWYNELSHLRTHSMLHLKSNAPFTVDDHSLKQRNIKVVELAQFIYSNSWTQLLVVTYISLK